MGEGLPRRLNFFALAGVLVQAGCPFTVVPDAYWEEATDTEGFAIAAISCPCGQKPTPGLGMPPVECQCGRFFFYAGPQVLSLAPPRPA